uniref:Uncharacterized protein n=1 Tax=Bactrocera latifrons TaxID=174628 RepID=A0A0K8W7T5_BACLA
MPTVPQQPSIQLTPLNNNNKTNNNIHIDFNCGAVAKAQLSDDFLRFLTSAPRSARNIQRRTKKQPQRVEIFACHKPPSMSHKRATNFAVNFSTSHLHIQAHTHTHIPSKYFRTCNVSKSALSSASTGVPAVFSSGSARSQIPNQCFRLGAHAHASAGTHRVATTSTGALLLLSVHCACAVLLYYIIFFILCLL